MKNKSTLAVVGVIVVIAVVVGVIAMGGSKDKNTTGSMTMNNNNGSDSSSSAVATDAVAIQNFAFSSATITVKVGTKVTWTNKDTATHTVTGEDNNGPASGNLGQGATYSFTFNKAGTYKYDCSIHSQMKGTVIVTN